MWGYGSQVALSQGVTQPPSAEKSGLHDLGLKAQEGDSDAQLSLGDAYKFGWGFQKDEAEAARWYRRAADQGNTDAQYELALLLIAGSGVPTNFEEAASWLRKSGEQGNGKALFNLALMYQRGRGVPKDELEAGRLLGSIKSADAESQFSFAAMFERGEGLVAQDDVEAFKWYLKAAGQGHVFSQRAVADMYRAGRGVQRDERAADDWLRKAERLSAPAYFRVAEMYRYGRGVAKDDAEAAKWYHKAAEQGHTEAQFNLAVMHNAGEGVPKDDAEAAQWFQKAAEQGDKHAQFNLASMIYAGEGVPKDDAKAVYWYRQAAEHGLAIAQFTLGTIYRTGKGVPKADAEAAKWFQKAAEQGDARAQWLLGHMYTTGEGLKQDSGEAARWFRRAADHGLPEAQTSLGRMLAEGDGVPKDGADAVMWFRKAAGQGDAFGQYLLGGAYLWGEGVPVNYTLAYAWSSLAAASGFEAAKELRDVLAEKMTREQIAEAQKIASDFRPKKWTTEPQGQQALIAAPMVVTGSGFFVTANGFFVTNHHVVAEAKRVRVRTVGGMFEASVVQVDPSNDIAVLKVVRADGEFVPLAVCGSRGLKLAERVATLGYPNPDLQGQTAKYSSGEIGALSGPGDDPRFLQISVPIQPGNSGGPLVNSAGCVVGVVVAQLDKIAALKTTGSLPENVNYAVKGTILLGVLEAVPGLADGFLAEPAKPSGEPTDVAKMVERACGMVLVEK